jgi:hypothetical protein
VRNALRVLALFDKRHTGDDALLQLASLRFKQGGLGSEFYAETPAELEKLLLFRPSTDAPAAVHLSRAIDLLDEEGRRTVLNFAAQFACRVSNLVVHDSPEIALRFDDYLGGVRVLNGELQRIKDSPRVYIEYASGLNPEIYIGLFRAIHDLERVSSCIDIGHLGLWRAKTAYAERHPGKNIFSLKRRSPELSALIEDIQVAVHSSIATVIQVIDELAKLQKPLHFHLHDGHPLSTVSPYGISDHLSFMTEIPIPFSFKGRELIRTMFGPSGLCRIVSESLRLLGPERVTFSLEIHPTEGRLPLGEATNLFAHWNDKINAERMNYWLSVLRANHLLLRECMLGAA